MTEPEQAPDVDQPEGGAPSREADGTGRTTERGQKALASLTACASRVV